MVASHSRSAPLHRVTLVLDLVAETHKGLTTAEIANARGYRIGNADVTLICERPKIGPHAAAMQARLEAILGCSAGRISVKATTSEKLGFTGREEGIAALASVTLVGG